MFNLNTLALKDTFTLVLKHPVEGTPLVDDEGNALSIEIYGTASKKYRDAVAAMQNRDLRRKAKKEKITAEQMKEEGIKLLVAVSEKANYLALPGEKTAIATSDEFKTLYSDPAFSWLKDQVDEAVGEVSNFLEQ